MSIRRNRHEYCHVKGLGGMWSIFVICLSIILFSSHSSAKTIWRIGKNDFSANEFGLPGSTEADPNINQEVVQFSPPQDPNAYDWQSFPCKIWPPEASFDPKEIHIAFDYPRDLRCPVLRIKAKSAVRNFTQGLTVIKGGDTLSQDLELPSFYPTDVTIPEIPLGIIRKGLHEENTLILKNISLTADNHSILFDYLELDDQDLDQDGDGSLDTEEIEGDIDEDGIENIADPDTATLLIEGKDSTKRKQITLDLQEKNGHGTLFAWLIPFDKNSPDISKRHPEGIFFPYGVFRAHIMDIPIETDTLMISIYTTEAQMIYDTVEFYLYEENDWRVLPVEILSPQEIHLSIGIDRGQENKDGNDSREFTITGGLAYPEGLDIDLENTGLCFIKSVWD
ncbi:MAG: hypothetical protein ACMUIM_09525 [bacterium]